MEIEFTPAACIKRYPARQGEEGRVRRADDFKPFLKQGSDKDKHNAKSRTGERRTKNSEEEDKQNFLIKKSVKCFERFVGFSR